MLLVWLSGCFNRGLDLSRFFRCFHLRFHFGFYGSLEFGFRLNGGYHGSLGFDRGFCRLLIVRGRWRLGHGGRGSRGGRVARRAYGRRGAR